MTHPNLKPRTFWIGLAALLLVGAYLGVRTELGVNTVLATRSSAAPAAIGVEEAEATHTLLVEVDTRTARIEQTALTYCDPFRPGRAPRRTQSGLSVMPGRSTGTRRTERPALGALLYDEVKPSVQLRVGAMTSGWLSPGESFEGWTVVDIQPGVVTVSQGGDTAVLQPF